MDRLQRRSYTTHLWVLTMGRKIELATRILRLGLYETLATWNRNHGSRLEDVEGIFVRDTDGQLWETKREIYDGYTDEAFVPLIDPNSSDRTSPRNADFFDYKHYRVVGKAPQNNTSHSLDSHL